MLASNHDNILEIFFKNEQKIENLYISYALSFPSHKDFWSRLAIKKRNQAAALKDLSLRAQSDKLVKAGGYVGQILNYISLFIDEQFEKLKQEKVVLNDALKTALRLERSLKEEQSLKLLEPRHDDVSRAFKTINHQAQQHVNILTKIYNRVAVEQRS